MAAKISLLAVVEYVTKPTKKNSRVYNIETKLAVKSILTSQLKAVSFLPNFGIDVFLRNSTGWTKGGYLSPTKSKGIYKGFVTAQEAKHFVLFQFPEYDERLIVRVYKSGFNPDKRTIAQMVQRLTD